MPVDDVNYYSDDRISDGNSDGKKNFFAGGEAPLQRMVQVQKIHQVAYLIEEGGRCIWCVWCI